MSQSSSAQILQSLFVAFAWAFDAQQIFITIFTEADPAWHCLKSTDRTCTAASSPCSLHPSSWVWTSPSDTSTISEWDLNCSGKALSSLPTSAFFMGCLIGGLMLSTLADSVLGRKKVLVLSCLIMSVAGALTALSPNIWVYSVLRFVSGFGRSAVTTCSLVLCTEAVDDKWRHRLSMSAFLFFTLGFLSLPPLAYICRRSSWRLLYLFTCIPALCYTILLNFIAKESTRWLSVNENTDKAKQFCQVFSSMKKLVTTRSTLWKLVSIMIVGYGTGMVYYGMPLSVGSLGPNLYLSVAYNALSELPTSLASFFLVEKVNRRSSLVALTISSGIFSLFCSVKGMTRAIKLAAEVIAFFSACMALNVTLIYSTELFPTCVRNSALALVRQAILLGSSMAPFLVAEGRRTSRLWSFGIFGIAGCCCGLFVLFLPETKGKTLTDNMDEEMPKEDSTI
ncbi:Organic cation/carnitine transporter 3 [Rhynchospora pubera]|uniref:Organic cation/carnitine transporter 3 n=1 Tax=Rhynchospora pubera TaxID=906938 RepID=A0AAV8G6Q9_9POAL|nr:Organic cation/carnitine transporter 3 [Rhynchospora pubera]